MTAIEFLNRLKKLPTIIQNCELQKQMWEDKALNTTSGGVSVQIKNKKTEETEIHNVEKVKSTSACSDPMGIAVASYVDIERKIEALKAEKERSEKILEQLEVNQYNVLYKFYILDLRVYEIADYLNRSYSYIEKTKRKGLKNLQTYLDNAE